MFNLISANNPFLEATVCFLHNSVSHLSDGKVNRFYLQCQVSAANVTNAQKFFGGGSVY